MHMHNQAPFGRNLYIDAIRQEMRALARRPARDTAQAIESREDVGVVHWDPRSAEAGVPRVAILAIEFFGSAGCVDVHQNMMHDLTVAWEHIHGAEIGG